MARLSSIVLILAGCSYVPSKDYVIEKITIPVITVINIDF